MSETRRAYQQAVPLRPALLSRRRRRQRASDDIRWSVALIEGIVLAAFAAVGLSVLFLAGPVPS